MTRILYLLAFDQLTATGLITESRADDPLATPFSPLPTVSDNAPASGGRQPAGSSSLGDPTQIPNPFALPPSPQQRIPVPYSEDPFVANVQPVGGREPADAPVPDSSLAQNPPFTTVPDKSASAAGEPPRWLIRIYPLKHVSAGSVHKIVTQLFPVEAMSHPIVADEQRGSLIVKFVELQQGEGWGGPDPEEFRQQLESILKLLDVPAQPAQQPAAAAPGGDSALPDKQPAPSTQPAVAPPGSTIPWDPRMSPSGSGSGGGFGGLSGSGSYSGEFKGPEGMSQMSAFGSPAEFLNALQGGGEMDSTMGPRYGGPPSRPTLAQRKSALDADTAARKAAEALRKARADKPDAPETKKLAEELRAEVEKAFSARQRLQQAEVAELAQRLADIQSAISRREKLKEQILNRRVEELLNPDLEWNPPATARTTGPAAADPGAMGAAAPTSPKPQQASSLVDPMLPPSGGAATTGRFDGMGGSYRDRASPDLSNSTPDRRRLGPLFEVEIFVDAGEHVKELQAKRAAAGEADKNASTKPEQEQAAPAVNGLQARYLQAVVIAPHGRLAFVVDPDGVTDALTKALGKATLTSLGQREVVPARLIKLDPETGIGVFQFEEPGEYAALELDTRPLADQQKLTKLEGAMFTSRSPAPQLTGSEVTLSRLDFDVPADRARFTVASRTAVPEGSAIFSQPNKLRGLTRHLLLPGGMGFGGSLESLQEVENSGLRQMMQLHNLLVPASEIERVALLDEQENEAEVQQKLQTTSLNLKQLMLGFHNYHDTFGHFPPAQLFGEHNRGGEHPHSWRVAILPFLDHARLYQQYRFDEPWDSDHNKTILDKMPDVFRSPLDKADSKFAAYYGLVTPGFTGIQAPADEKPNWSLGTFFSNPKGTPIRSITDGTSNTVAIIEARREIPWTKPEDIPYSADEPLPELGGWFEKGFFAGFADGSVKMLSKDNTEETFRNLFLIGDGRPVQPAIIDLQPRPRP